MSGLSPWLGGKAGGAQEVCPPLYSKSVFDMSHPLNLCILIGRTLSTFD